MFNSDELKTLYYVGLVVVGLAWSISLFAWAANQAPLSWFALSAINLPPFIFLFVVRRAYNSRVKEDKIQEEIEKMRWTKQEAK